MSNNRKLKIRVVDIVRQKKKLPMEESEKELHLPKEPELSAAPPIPPQGVSSPTSETPSPGRIEWVKEEAPEEKLFHEGLKKDLSKIERQIDDFEKREIERFADEDEKRSRQRFTFKSYLLISLLVLVLAGAVYAAIEFLPRVTVKITTAKREWNYTDSVSLSKSVSEVDFANRVLPAELFSLRKNFNFSFPATGRKEVKEKARGKIIIYNTYSSDPQPLVQSTRFATPEGKIFRLEKGITVPGAKISEGQIVASSIETNVVSDEPGPDYNVGPVSRFSIPGLKNTAKYKAFYAESKEPMKGGFVGEIAYPTDADIESGKTEARKKLEESMNSALVLQVPKEFKIIDGARDFVILKEEVNKEVDGESKFRVYVNADLKAIVFRESDLLALMRNLATDNLMNPEGREFKYLINTFEIKDYNIEYGEARSDFVKGDMSFALNFKGKFSQPVDMEAFKGQIPGKQENDFRTLAFSLPNAEKVVISFWPFWVKTAPDDLNRIGVEVE